MNRVTEKGDDDTSGRTGVHQCCRERYLRADKRGKGKIMDEGIQVTDYRRKSLPRLLRRRERC